MSRGKAERHIEDIRTWVAEGRSNRWMADQIHTDEASIRRAKLRHSIDTPRPEGASHIPGAKGSEWGYGEAQLVTPISANRKTGETITTEKVVALFDQHYPYQDDAVINSAIKLIKREKPDRVIIGGDVCDFFQLSRFNAGYERLDTLQWEIDLANDFRKRVRDAAPDHAVIDEVEGNHDNRIRSYVARQGRALASLKALRPESLFGYDEYGINFHPGCGFLLRPDFLVKHGTAVSAIPGGTARNELLGNMVSGISGHVHRAEQSTRVAYRTLQWTVAGCMCRLTPDYITGRPNWTQGILLVEVSNKTGAQHVTQIPMFEGKLRYGGKAY
jgi:predicted phosphodiesterase